MSDVTRILSQIELGDPNASEQLLPLVYAELRKLAASRLARENPGQTLQATALVHEAYLRLTNTPEAPSWNGRAHFFSAAAEAMQRILVEQARRKLRLKRGGNHQRVDLELEHLAGPNRPEDLLAIDEALAALSRLDSQAAQLVKLRYFAGLSVEDAAHNLGISRSTAYAHWAYARAWLQCRLREGEGSADVASPERE